ncbi:MAG: hypothetical protein ACT4P1_01200 [Sporichthyaceae bacterium]
MAVGRRVALSAGALALSLAGSGVVLGGVSAAEAGYAGVAEATGVRVILTNASIPLGVSPQLQGPTAVAEQNSLQQSDAYAAFPFPGEEVAGIPGVVGGTAGIPLPAYPFVVSTTAGDDVRQLSYPGIELRSESGSKLTQASATGGSTANGATATARVINDAGIITALATSDVDAVRLGEALLISGLTATAQAERAAATELTRSSALGFTSLSAPALTLTIPGAPGTPATVVPAPSFALRNGQFFFTGPGSEPTGTPVPARDFAKAMTDAGIPTSYQQPRKTPDGIIGAGLEFTVTLPAPPEGSPGGFSGETPVTFSVGLLRAEVSFTPSPDAPTAPALTPITPAETAEFAPPVLGAPLPQVAPSQPVAVGEIATGITPAAPAPAGIDLTALQGSRAAIGSDIGWLYLLVAAVGVAAFGGTVVLRLRGVRG